MGILVGILVVAGANSCNGRLNWYFGGYFGEYSGGYFGGCRSKLLQRLNGRVFFMVLIFVNKFLSFDELNMGK